MWKISFLSFLVLKSSCVLALLSLVGLVGNTKGR